MSSGSNLIDVIVSQRNVIGATAILELAAGVGGALPRFTAGAHIDVHLYNGLIRQYSLCNDPGETERYVLGVLLEPKSRGGSVAVHADLVEGCTVRVSMPRNNFVLHENAAHSILLAGGIGITPLLGMAWRLYRLGASFEFHYCVRSITLAGFQAHLQGTPFADHISVHTDDGGAEQRLDIANVLGYPSDKAHVYVCGPGGFIDFIVAQAKALGWSDQNVHLERFSQEADVSGNAFTVRAARTGIEVQVPEGRSIAEVLIEAGIDIPLSCEQGVCGTCLTRVIEGIPDHRDICLMDDEKAANDIMTPCCSRAKTPILVLDL